MKPVIDQIAQTVKLKVQMKKLWLCTILHLGGALKVGTGEEEFRFQRVSFQME